MTSVGVDVDFLASSAVLESDDAVSQGEQGIVAAYANVQSWQDTGSALADEDIAGHHGLAAEFFDSEALGFGITTVSGGALTFFMCHGAFLRRFFG
jgi:hypothetical protein